MIDAGWIFAIMLAMFYLCPTLAIIGGVVAMIWPRAAWYANIGWKIRGAKPTTLALVMTRIGGLFGCGFGALSLTIVIHLFPISIKPGAPPVPPAQAPPALIPK